jgi:hypothetical protein
MHITVTRTGGFAGLSETSVSMDTDTLASTDRERVAQALKEAGLLSMPKIAPSKPVGADMFHYQLTILDGGTQHKISFVDDGSADVKALRKLIATLKELAGSSLR